MFLSELFNRRFYFVAFPILIPFDIFCTSASSSVSSDWTHGPFILSFLFIVSITVHFSHCFPFHFYILVELKGNMIRLRCCLFSM